MYKRGGRERGDDFSFPVYFLVSVSVSVSVVCYSLHRGDHFYTWPGVFTTEERSLFPSSLPSLSLRSTTTPRWGKIIYDPVPEWTSVIGPKILWQLPSFKTVDGFADRNSSFHYTRVSLERGAVFSVPRSPLCLS